MNTYTANSHIYRDDEGDKLGMWLFIFTELFLFGMLFMVYAVYRYRNPIAFRLSAEELNVTNGLLNTILFLISSATVAMSVTAIKNGNKQHSLMFIYLTLFITALLLLNIFFQWRGIVAEGFYPNAAELINLGYGTILFFGIFWVFTSLHTLHIVVGIGLFIYVILKINKNEINSNDHVWLENTGLFWNLIVLISVFLFPLFYLIN